MIDSFQKNNTHILIDIESISQISAQLVCPTLTACRLAGDLQQLWSLLLILRNIYTWALLVLAATGVPKADGAIGDTAPKGLLAGA